MWVFFVVVVFFASRDVADSANARMLPVRLCSVFRFVCMHVCVCVCVCDGGREYSVPRPPLSLSLSLSVSISPSLSLSLLSVRRALLGGGVGGGRSLPQRGSGHTEQL